MPALTRFRNISTPSIQLDQAQMIVGPAGREAEPQLPMIAVVTPFWEEGVMSWLQVTWPS